jgi:ATP-dependent Zn protease
VNELHTKHSVDVLIAFVGNKIDMEEERVVETFVRQVLPILMIVMFSFFWFFSREQSNTLRKISYYFLYVV